MNCIAEYGLGVAHCTCHLSNESAELRKVGIPEKAIPLLILLLSTGVLASPGLRRGLLLRQTFLLAVIVDCKVQGLLLYR